MIFTHTHIFEVQLSSYLFENNTQKIHPIEQNSIQVLTQNPKERARRYSSRNNFPSCTVKHYSKQQSEALSRRPEH